jgi:3-oxoacyl-[acyl-carrier-protein] synthase I
MTPPDYQAVVVTALGMVTSLGRDAISSCAAARAGLTRSSPLKVLDFHAEALFGRETLEGPPEIFGHTVRGVAEGFGGPAKLLLLGEAALDDLFYQRPLSDNERATTGLVLNLSDRYLLDADARARGEKSLPSEVWRQQTARIAARLAESCSLRPPPACAVVSHGGHAGVAAVLQNAVAMITRGEVDRCIVGAIDCLAEPSMLRAAARLGLLRTNDNPVGLAPGEAAAVFLVERERDALRGRLPALATLVTAAVERNDVDLLVSDPPSTGVGLAALLDPIFESFTPLGVAIGDLNGTPHRALEWGGAWVRLGKRHRLADVSDWFPALSFGDTGAAAGAVGVCMATRAFARRYAPGMGALICLSSENGTKGAVVLRAPAS